MFLTRTWIEHVMTCTWTFSTILNTPFLLLSMHNLRYLIDGDKDRFLELSLVVCRRSSSPDKWVWQWISRYEWSWHRVKQTESYQILLLCKWRGEEGRLPSFGNLVQPPHARWTFSWLFQGIQASWLRLEKNDESLQRLLEHKHICWLA